MLIEELEKALKAYGIKKLNEIQLKSLKLIEKGRSCLIVAPTGSGKTEAAIVPALNEVLKRKLKPVSIIYITPLRALNRDVVRRIENLANLLKLKVAVRHGDTSKSERLKQSRKPPDVLVTTPETFQLLFLGKRLREWLKNVKFLVIDEVHELFQSKRGTQLSIAVERLREIANFQTICLSATVKRVKEVSRFFAGNCEMDVVLSEENKVYEIEVIKPEVKESDVELAKKLFVDVDVASQLRYIAEVVGKEKSLIFVNTRQTAEALALKLKKIVEVEVHHGSLSKEARLEAERKFLSGEIKALICTSSMELGIDIGDVDRVVQYSSPRQVSRLLQRAGRSGHRKGKVSRGYIIVKDFDDIMESWVIAEKAIKGEIEEEICHEKSLDTLANQIVAMVMEYKEIEVEKAYSIVKRAYPYRNLSFDEFLEVCKFLSDNGLLSLDLNENKTMRFKRKARIYFYDNISMIPDEKRYEVVDIASNKVVGTLDEVFVTTFRGEVFAMKGELWRIVDVGERVRVEPVSSEGEIPSWVGEEIPVPFEVAIEVGELRESIKKMLKAFGKEKTLKILVEKFGCKEACREVVDVIEKTEVIPSSKTITVDKGVTINACFGHTVNEVFGRTLATLLAAKRGTSISVEIDPYRIKLYPASVDEVMESMKNLKTIAEKGGLEWLAERAMLDTKLFQWKIVSAARKFGILSKNADLTRMNLKKFALKLKGTPVYREAVREILTERFDVKKLYSILSKLFEEIEVLRVNNSEISKISRGSFDLFLPSKPTSAIIQVFKKRLENEECIFYCINCGCTLKLRVRDAITECIKCKSKLIACVNAKRGLEEFSKDELVRIANLVMSYGKKAIYAMNTYGIGAETAARILSRYYRSEEEFFKALLDAEKNYVRTRKFWRV